jgi:SAM-dependent methyltransferase
MDDYMKKEWFEAWFDSPYYHLLYKGRDEQEAQKSLDNLLLALDLPPGANIMDLACGKGRHSRHLAEKGFRVTGLDISESSISFARQFESENLEFFQHDMRKPFRVNYFDGILNMFTSFGYFKTDREHLLSLRNIAINLRPGGVFLLDYFNSKWVRANLVATETKIVEGVTFQLSKHINNGYVYKTVAFEFDGEPVSFTESVRLFEMADFEQLFAACRLKIVKVYGGYDLRNFDPANAQRLILVVEKEA